MLRRPIASPVVGLDGAHETDKFPNAPLCEPVVFYPSLWPPPHHILALPRPPLFRISSVLLVFGSGLELELKLELEFRLPFTVGSHS
jgi:hypothetical protein